MKDTQYVVFNGTKDVPVGQIIMGPDGKLVGYHHNKYNGDLYIRKYRCPMAISVKFMDQLVKHGVEDIYLQNRQGETFHIKTTDALHYGKHTSLKWEPQYFVHEDWFDHKALPFEPPDKLVTVHLGRVHKEE